MGGVWELIDMVEDVDCLSKYNWATVVYQFLVDALDETKEKMRTTKNMQINGFAMALQVSHCYYLWNEVLLISWYVMLLNVYGMLKMW